MDTLGHHNEPAMLPIDEVPSFQPDALNTLPSGAAAAAVVVVVI